MSELLNAFGINLKAIIFQSINFAIVLIVLARFVYRPLMRLVEERRKKIELGIKGGEEAAKLIAEADTIKGEKIRDGETEAVAIITRGEAQGTKRSQEIVSGAEKKAEYIIEEALATSAKRKQEEMQNVALEAQAMVKAALIKTVELSPEQVDDKLIHKALEVMKHGA